MSVTKLEDAILTSVFDKNISEQFKLGKIKNNLLSSYLSSIKNLSTSYTSYTPKTITKIDASAYALYYLPINYLKCLHLFKLAEIDPEINYKVLDFGSGPGTASLAFIDYRGHFNDKILAVDKSKSMLEIGKQLANHYQASNLNFSLLYNNIFNTNYDLIIFANSLNELGNSSQNLLEKAISALAPNGTLLILEPALQKITRNLMQLRNQLLSKFSDLIPIYPCTRTDDCPMLKESPTDWCHTELLLEKSRLVDQIDQLTNFNKHKLKFSALILKRGGKIKSGLRIVSIPEKTKYGLKVRLCGANFYNLVALSKDNKSESNKKIFKAKLHELIEIKNIATTLRTTLKLD